MKLEEIGFYTLCDERAEKSNESVNMRQERVEFLKKHDPHKDPICRNNCLDVCIDHLKKCHEIRVKK